MRFILFIVAFCVVATAAMGQEIITHGFVDCSACPTTVTQVHLCTGWRQPTEGTSDYFNACHTGLLVGVPKNYFGYQNHNNKAYVGLYTYYKRAGNYKEYIGTKIKPLVVGTNYTISIEVSLADSSYYATDGLGILFTMDEYSATNYGVINRTPQVDYSSYGPIKDKKNWVKLTKSFIADSAYEYLIVGSFKDNAITIKEPYEIHTAGLFDTFSYYYIGQIGVPDTVLDTNVKVVPAMDTVKYTFPNAFTPNKDNTNNAFHLITNHLDKIQGYNLMIFNRWGQRVFVTDDPNSGWDGTFMGTTCELGVYMYVAKFTVDNVPHMMKGNITLIR